MECPNLNADMEPIKLGSWTMVLFESPVAGAGQLSTGQRILVISSIHHPDSSRVGVESAAFVG